MMSALLVTTLRTDFNLSAHADSSKPLRLPITAKIDINDEDEEVLTHFYIGKNTIQGLKKLQYYYYQPRDGSTPQSASAEEGLTVTLDSKSTPLEGYFDTTVFKNATDAYEQGITYIRLRDNTHVPVVESNLVGIQVDYNKKQYGKVVCDARHLCDPDKKTTSYSESSSETSTASLPSDTSMSTTLASVPFLSGTSPTDINAWFQDPSEQEQAFLSDTCLFVDTQQGCPTS